MFTSRFIKSVATPGATVQGTGDEAIVVDGISEYVAVLSGEATNIKSKMESANTWVGTTTVHQLGFAIWIKKAHANNTAGNQQTVFHNGGAGHNTFEIYFDNGDNELKYKIGNGSSTLQIDTGYTFTIDEWTHVIWHKMNTGGNPYLIVRINGDIVSTIDDTGDRITDIVGMGSLPTMSFIGCYKEGPSGTATEFFNGTWTDFVAAQRNKAGEMLFPHYTWNDGVPRNLDNLGSVDFLIWLRPGEGEFQGFVDGFQDICLFDCMQHSNINNERTLIYSKGYHFSATHPAGDWTGENEGGWAIDGDELVRTGGSLTASSSMVHTDSSDDTEALGLNFVRINKEVTTASDVADTVTWGGVTIDSTTTNYAFTEVEKFFSPTNANDFTITAGADSDSRTTMAVQEIRLECIYKGGVMVNLTTSTDLVKDSPYKIRGHGGGGSGAR